MAYMDAVQHLEERYQVWNLLPGVIALPLSMDGGEVVFTVSLACLNVITSEQLAKCCRTQSLLSYTAVKLAVVGTLAVIQAVAMCALGDVTFASVTTIAAFISLPTVATHLFYSIIAYKRCDVLTYERAVSFSESWNKQQCKRGVALFKEGIQKMHTQSYYGLSLCYSRGAGVKKDLKKAEGLLKKGAKEKDPYCISELIDLELMGTGMDKKRAVQQLQKAKTANANYYLGLHTLPSDYKKGVRYLKKAYEAGHRDATAVLARVLYENFDHRFLLKEFNFWKKFAREDVFKIALEAAKKGSKEAAQFVVKMASKGEGMYPEWSKSRQKIEAKEVASYWKAQLKLQLA